MFDIFTLLSVLALTHLLSTVSLAVVWYLNKSMPGIKEWTIGRLLVTLAMLIVAMRLHIPLALSVIGGTAMLIVGYYIVLNGYRSFMGRARYSHTLFIISFFVFVGLMSYFVIPENNLAGRSVVIVVYSVLYCALVVHTLWPRKNDKVVVSSKVTASIFIFHGIFYLLLVMVSLSGLSGSTLMQPSIGTQSILVEGIAFSILTSMLFITMTTEHLQQDLKRQATIDPLTGTYNRRAFYSLADHALIRQKRAADELSLVCLDLDHFKKINDGWGHSVGDQVLKAAVDIINDCKREQDILARFGGEEFVIAMPATPQQDAQHVAERMRKAIEQALIYTTAKPISITVSFGVTSTATHEVSGIDTLIAHADKALYRAKQDGRNAVVLYTPGLNNTAQHA